MVRGEEVKSSSFGHARFRTQQSGNYSTSKSRRYVLGAPPIGRLLGRIPRSSAGRCNPPARMVHPKGESVVRDHAGHCKQPLGLERGEIRPQDRKSTRLNSSHLVI